MSDRESNPTIVGVGMYVPEQRLSNQGLIDYTHIDLTPADIEARTGIVERRWADVGTLTSDMAVSAARGALTMADVQAHELATLHLSTNSPDYATPSTASVVHGKLRAPETCAAADVSAACAGFVYGVMAAANSLRAMTEDGPNALVVGTEIISKWLNRQDRRSVILFGDGAGAAVLQMRPGAAAPAMATLTHPDAHAIYAPAGNAEGDEGKLVMNGRAVKEHALAMMPRVSLMAAQRAGLTDHNGDIDWSQIDLFVPHQANGLLIKAVGEAIGVPSEKCLATVDQYGNTSSASIPMALATAHQEGRIGPGRKRVLMTAIGAGMVAGAVVIDMDLSASI